MQDNKGIVRRATEEDLPEIFDLEQKYIPDGYDMKTLQTWFDFQKEMFWCFEKDGKITAFNI